MKKFSTIALVAVVGLWTAAAQGQTDLAVWTFEAPNTPADATNFATYPNAVLAASGVFSATATGAGVHEDAATDWSTPVGNGSVDSFSSNQWAVAAPFGDNYYQFCTESTGYTSITIDWDQTSSNTGPRDFELFYDVGSGYTSVGTYIVLPNAAPNPVWNSTTSSAIYNISFNLPAAADNAASLCFRMIQDSVVSASGGAVGTGGTSRVDNVRVRGVPEPATLALLGLGGLFIRRRK